MALDTATAQQLIQKLNADREAYLESVNKTHQLLLQAIASAPTSNRNGGPASGLLPDTEDYLPAPPMTLSNLAPLPPPHHPTSYGLWRGTQASSEIESFIKDGRTSILTGEDDDSNLDDTESLFVKTPLKPVTCTEEGFKKHIQEYNFTWSGKQILQNVLDPSAQSEYLQRKSVFPTELGEQPDRSHLSHYTIFDVGEDGAPLPILDPVSQGDVSRSMAIWNRLKSLNDDPARTRKAVGRITIIREPSPLLFAALHYTQSDHFNMDELFQFLVDDDPELARPPDPFSDDHRMQRSIAFTFEYFTIIDSGCEPMGWQRSDPRHGVARTHIPISRCSSVVALSLEGAPMSQVKNKQRRAKKKIGNVFDPFSPWRVLSITAYPDERSSLDAHDTTNHYVNGPEAFLVTLRAEFRDAAKRLTAVYKEITAMVEPPPDFIFNLDTRDKLLFEDNSFTYSRRYFWAFQTLGIMNEDIHDMILAYQETFKDGVWNGSDKIIWPGSADATTSSKHTNWRRRMKGLRRDIEREIARLKDIQTMNTERMRIVKGLHGNLFNGTSVLESRKSVQTAMITVQQGRNIKLLTLVTIFFLPLTFVTSVFGMTNMPQHGPMDHFAWATIAICIPTYILIGSLNTTSGMEWWTKKTNDLLSNSGHLLALFLDLFHYRPSWTRAYHDRPSHTSHSEEDEIFAWNEKKTRVRHQQAEIVPRGTFQGMPTLSPQATDIADGSANHIDSPAATPSEKDRTPIWAHRNSNPPLPSAYIPPHRPSIGIVPLPGQALPSERSLPLEDGNDHNAENHESEKGRDLSRSRTRNKSSTDKSAKERLAMHSANTAEDEEQSDDDTSSEDSTHSLPSSRRKSMFTKVFRTGGGGGSAASMGGGSTHSHGKQRRSHDQAQ